MNQMHALVTSAVDPLRTQLRSCSPAKLVDRCVGMRPGKLDSPAAATKFALRELARRHRALDEEVVRFDAELSRLVAKRAPRLRALVGVGTDVAGALLVTAGDNPDRLRSLRIFFSIGFLNVGREPILLTLAHGSFHKLPEEGGQVIPRVHTSARYLRSIAIVLLVVTACDGGPPAASGTWR